MQRALNSFTRYTNQLRRKRGPLFMPRFKAVRVTSNAQLMHVSRYIHLQQYSSSLVHTFDDLISLKESSLSDYQSYKRAALCNPKIVLNSFRKNPEAYLSFVKDRADYQRTLEFSKTADKYCS